jgi:hypothetical protein
MTINFNDPAWRPFARDWLEKHKIVPHELRQNTVTQQGVLIVRQSNKYAEYALGETGLDYLHNAVKAGKCPQGYVVLIDRKRNVVGYKPVSEVVALLLGITPRDGSLGPYWWLNPDFSRNGPGQVSDSFEDPPF